MTSETKDTRGLLSKFNVSRTDGRDRPGEKHEGCDYFVLDLTHDPDAITALAAYANACRERRPVLAADLGAKVRAWCVPCSGVHSNEDGTLRQPCAPPRASEAHAFECYSPYFGSRVCPNPNSHSDLPCTRPGCGLPRDHERHGKEKANGE